MVGRSVGGRWSVGRSVGSSPLGLPGLSQALPGLSQQPVSELASEPVAGRAPGERGRAPGEPEPRDGPKARRLPTVGSTPFSIHRPSPPHQPHTTTHAHTTRTPAHTCTRAHARKRMHARTHVHTHNAHENTKLAKTQSCILCERFIKIEVRGPGSQPRWCGQKVAFCVRGSSKLKCGGQGPNLDGAARKLHFV